MLDSEDSIRNHIGYLYCFGTPGYCDWFQLAIHNQFFTCYIHVRFFVFHNYCRNVLKISFLLHFWGEGVNNILGVQTPITNIYLFILWLS